MVKARKFVLYCIRNLIDLRFLNCMLQNMSKSRFSAHVDPTVGELRVVFSEIPPYREK